MRKLLIIANVLLITSTSFAQNDGYLFSDARHIRGDGSDLSEEGRFRNKILTEAEIANILGSQYGNDNFQRSEVYQNGKVVLKDVMLRYNALADYIELNDPKTLSTAASMTLWKDPEAKVMIKDDAYRYISGANSVGNGGYFKIIVDNEDGKLYSKTTIKYSEGEKAKTPYEKDRPARFDRQDTYYMVKDGKFIEMPDRSSKILGLMDDKKQEMKKFMKSNKLNLKDEKDVGKLVSHYLSLQ